MAQNSGIAHPISANGFSRNEPTRENSDRISGRIRTVVLAFIRLTNRARDRPELDRYQSSAETLEVAIEKGKLSRQYSRIVEKLRQGGESSESYTSKSRSNCQGARVCV